MRTYDDWKTDPEDETLGVHESYGECDCCGKPARLRQCWAFGNMETWACDECTEEPSDFWDGPAERKS